MTMSDNCFAELKNITGVVGAFLRHSSGNIICSHLPEHFAQGQVESTVIRLNQQEGLPVFFVKDIQRKQFAYYDFTIYVYALSKGELFVLCRSLDAPDLLDQKVIALQTELSSALKKGTGSLPKGNGVRCQTVERHNDTQRSPFLLLLIACLTLIIIGGGFYIYTQQGHSITAVATQTIPATVSEAIEVVAVNEPAIPVVNEAAKPVVTEEVETLLKIEGSFTLGEQLSPQIAMAFMRDEMFAKDVHLVKKETLKQQVVGTLEDGKTVAIDIISSTSGGAFSCLDTGRCDIGMSARPINRTEMSKLDHIGPMTNSASEHILALDGVAVILHPVNRIDALDLQQVEDIFTGKISSWSELPESGLSGPINIYGREHNTGSSAVFRYLALHDKPFASTLKTVSNDSILATSVGGDKQAIGFVSMSYMKDAKAIAINQQGSTTVFPTPFTVSTEDYPLSRRLYYYTAVNPENYLVRPFFQFALGDVGQSIVQEQGFVALTIDKIRTPLPAQAPSEYRQSVEGANRLSLNFRFRSGSSELDNRGKRDLERLIAFLIKPENRGKSIRLLGFADNRGERKANCYLSKIRAEKVATILQWRGITTETIEGFCDDMPIATNTTALGRERNRRVEVWLGS